MLAPVAAKSVTGGVSLMRLVVVVFAVMIV